MLWVSDMWIILIFLGLWTSPWLSWELLQSRYRCGFIRDDELHRHHKEDVPRLLHNLVFRKDRLPRCCFTAVTDWSLWILWSGIGCFLFLPQNRHASFRQETPRGTPRGDFLTKCLQPGSLRNGPEAASGWKTIAFPQEYFSLIPSTAIRIGNRAEGVL